MSGPLERFDGGRVFQMMHGDFPRSPRMDERRIMEAHRRASQVTRFFRVFFECFLVWLVEEARVHLLRAITRRRFQEPRASFNEPGEAGDGLGDSLVSIVALGRRKATGMSSLFLPVNF